MALTVLVPLTDVQDRYYETISRDHQNQPETGRCAVCHVRDCITWAEAKAARAMAGRDDWDPLRERAREQLWQGSLKDQ